MDNTAVSPIVVGVDGSPSSRDALIRAATIAEALKAPLRVVTTWDFPSMLASGYDSERWSPEADAREILSDALVDAFPGDLPANLIRVVTQGKAAPALLEESWHAQMLVVGSRGHGGFAGLLLGSVSSALAQHAHCPVLVMHGTAARG